MNCHHEVAAATEGSAFCRFHRKADSSRASPLVMTRTRGLRDLCGLRGSIRFFSAPPCFIFILRRSHRQEKNASATKLNKIFPKMGLRRRHYGLSSRAKRGTCFLMEEAKKQIPRGLNFTPTSARTALVGDPCSPA